MGPWAVDVLAEGARKVAGRKGRVLVGAYLVVFVPVVLAADALAFTWLVDGLDAVAGVDVDASAVVEMPDWLAGLAVVLCGLVIAGLTIGALRAFLGRSAQGLSRAQFVAGMPAVGVHFIAGAVAFTIIWAIGLVALVVPGIVAWGLLIYWTVAVVEEDATVPEAMHRSLELTAGNRLQVVALFLAYWVLVVIALAAAAAAHTVEPLLGRTLLAVTAAVLTVYLLSITSVSYVHLWADAMAVEPSVDGFEEFMPASETLEGE